MKDSVKSGLKKFLVGLIACLMLLGIVPIGMITMRPHTDADAGVFLRFAPEAEACVSAVGSSPMRNVSTAGLYQVGCRSDVYFKFDLQSLSEKDIAENMNRSVLRLIALPSNTPSPVPLRLWLMPDSDWNASTKYVDRPVAFGEKNLAEWNGNPSGRESAVLETDLTEHIKSLIQAGKHTLSLHLDTPVTNAYAIIAGSGFEDAAYRPCLKAVTGEAEDPDPSDLTKSVLTRSAVSADGSSLYLQYRFQPENIQGAMYDITFRDDTAIDFSQTQISVLPQAEWNEGSTPTGDAVPVIPHTDEAFSEVTDAVNDVYAAGKTEITFCLSGDANRFSDLRKKAEAPPQLAIHVSDEEHIVSAVEASVYALRDNPSPGEISSDLSDSYTTEAGITSELRWSTTVSDADDPVERISKKGEISRPAWFQNDETVLTSVSIKSGDYERIRRYALNLIPEPMPEFDKAKVSDYIDISQSSANTGRCLEAVRASVQSRWIGRRYYAYRTVDQNALLAATLKTVHNCPNYLTLKLWGEEIPNLPLCIESLQHPDAPSMELTVPEQQTAEDGFLYLSYRIPEEYLTEDDFVSLRLSTPSSAFSEGAIPWNLYGIFSGQTSFFRPQNYAKQGEHYEKTVFGQNSFSGFLKKLYHKAQDMGVLPKNEEEASSEPEEIVTDSETGMLAVNDVNSRFAVFCPKDSSVAEVFRSAEEYHTYAKLPVEKEESGIYRLDYDRYQILFNHAEKAQTIPDAFGLSGVYQDLQSDICYAFLQNGELADDSVLPEGAVLKSGKELLAESNATLVLKHLSDPLYASSWRISAINGISVSRVKHTYPLTVAAVTVKDVGKTPEAGETMRVICCVYDQNRLAGYTTQTFTPIAGHSEYHVGFAPVTVEAGQQLKIFVEPAKQQPHPISPKFEL